MSPATAPDTAPTINGADTTTPHPNAAAPIPRTPAPPKMAPRRFRIELFPFRVQESSSMPWLR